MPDDQRTLFSPLDSDGDSRASHGPGALVAGRYAIHQLVGTGAMGSVYRAYDHELDETVALKTIRHDLADEPGLLERLRLEVKLARRVTHRNVARVFDIGDHEGQKFLTMELLDGAPLTQWIRPGGIPIPEAIDLVLPICEALDAAHAAGVVHRDLKPDNVVVAPDGRVAVTDFGVACLARTVAAGEDMVGTPAYMAPEQVTQVEVDARADLYALGHILFELLTGEMAFLGESAIVVATARLAVDAPDVRTRRSDVPTELAAIVAKLLARDPDDRCASAREVADALARVVATRAAPSRNPSSAPSRGKTVAVLPFRATPKNAHVAEALTDDLVEVLAMTPGLGVVSRTRVAALDGVRDPRVVGEKLGAQLVVDGSVAWEDDAYVIAVKLRGAGDGFPIWSERFRRPASELLVLNDAVARAVCRAVAADTTIEREAVSDPRALETYFRARRILREGWYGVTDVAKSVALLEEAAALAPRDPTIGATLALGLARLVFLDQANVEQARRRASEAARRAVLVSPQSGEAWLALGSIHVYEGASAKAVPALVRSMRASASLARTREMLGRLLVEAGLVAEGRKLLEAALGLDPLSFTPRWDIVQAHALAGQWDEVDTLLALSVPDAGGEAMRALLHARFLLWRRRSVAESELGPAPASDDAGAIIARALRSAVLEKRRNDRTRDLEALLSSATGRNRRLVLQFVTEVRLALGEPSAKDTLEEAIASGFDDLGWLDGCPLVKSLEADARWPEWHAVVAERARAVRIAWAASTSR